MSGRCLVGLLGLASVLLIVSFCNGSRKAPSPTGTTSTQGTPYALE